MVSVLGLGVVLLVVILVGVGLVVMMSGRSGRISPISWILAVLLLLVVVGGVLVTLAVPRTVTLRIDGDPGASFVGTVTLDGVEQRIEGVVPQEFEYPARHVEFVAIPADPRGARLEFKLQGSTVSSSRGGKGIYQRQFVGAYSSMSGLGTTEYDQAVADLLPEEKGMAEGADEEPASTDSDSPDDSESPDESSSVEAE